jgi:thymidine kinase
VAFPGSRRLLEIAHSLEELKTICRCGRKAVFNARTVGDQFIFDGDQVAIDGVDVGYQSLCGACYLEESGGVLNSGWRPKIDFSYGSAPDSDFA